GHSQLAAGRPACPRALGPCRSDRAPHQRARGAQRAAGYARADAARVAPADHPQPGVDGHQGLWGPGSGTSLCPGARAVPAGGGSVTALPGVAGATIILYRAGGVTNSARVGRAAPQPGSTPARPRAPRGGPPVVGIDLILAWRVECGARALGAGD